MKTFYEELKSMNIILKGLGKDAEYRAKKLDEFINARIRSRPAEKESVLRYAKEFSENDFKLESLKESEEIEKKIKNQIRGLMMQEGKMCDDATVDVLFNAMMEKQKNKEKEKEDHKLTPEQIVNWRKMLSMILGPYAFLMSGEEVQKIRDNMQNNVDNLPKGKT